MSALAEKIEAASGPDRGALTEALTPSGDTKAAYMGEFSFNLTQVDEFGDEHQVKTYVPWTTIKEIMAAIRARAALRSRAASETMEDGDGKQ